MTSPFFDKNVKQPPLQDNVVAEVDKILAEAKFQGEAPMVETINKLTRDYRVALWDVQKAEPARKAEIEIVLNALSDIYEAVQKHGIRNIHIVDLDKNFKIIQENDPNSAHGKAYVEVLNNLFKTEIQYMEINAKQSVQKIKNVLQDKKFAATYTPEQQQKVDGLLKHLSGGKNTVTIDFFKVAWEKEKSALDPNQSATPKKGM